MISGRYNRILVLAMAALIMAAPMAPEAVAVKSKTQQTSGGTRSKKKKSGKAATKTTQSKSTRNQGRRKLDTAPKSSAEAKRLQEAAQRDIRQTKERLRLNEQEIKSGLADLNRLSSEIATGRAKVGSLQKKVNSLGNEIESLGSQIEKNEAELKRMREEYLKAVKKMRLTKRNQSALAFIFASEDFNQALRRLRYMRQFSAWKEKQTADIDLKIRELGGEKERLAQARQIHATVLGQLTASQRELESKHSRQERLVADLRQNGSALQSHLAAKQNEANRLKESIATLIAQEQAKAEAERKAREKAEAERIARLRAQAEREERERAEAERRAAEEKAAAEAASLKSDAERKEAEKRAKKERQEQEKREKQEKKKREKEAKKKKNSEKGSRGRKDRRKKDESVRPAAPVSESPRDANVNFASLRGSLPRPVDGAWRITNAFGRHSMPELPEVVYDNPGVDAEVQTGATVKAVCAGRVSGVYKVAGYGNVVIVNHGEYYTVYGNLSSVSVSVGTSVRSGQAVGVAAPDPDDPRRGSVHFEVWKGREKQNPQSWLR